MYCYRGNVYHTEWRRSWELSVMSKPTDEQEVCICPYPPSAVLCLLSLFQYSSHSPAKDISYFGMRERGMDGMCVIYFTLNKHVLPLHDRSQYSWSIIYPFYEHHGEQLNKRWHQTDFMCNNRIQKMFLQTKDK